MNDGYLEDKTVVNYDGNEITSSNSNAKKSEKVIFKSKYSGGAWQYAGTGSSKSNNEMSILKTFLRTVFSKHFFFKITKTIFCDGFASFFH